jgi:hypothetical protein
MKTTIILISGIALLCLAFSGCTTASVVAEHGPAYNGQKNYFIAPGLSIHKDSYRSAQLVAQANAALQKAGFVPHTADMQETPLMILVDHVVTTPVSGSSSYSYPIYGMTSSGGVSTTVSTATASATGPGGTVYGQGTGYSTTSTPASYGTVGVATGSYSYTFYPQSIEIEALRKVSEKQFLPAWRTIVTSAPQKSDTRGTAEKLIRISTPYLGKDMPKKSVMY